MNTANRYTTPTNASFPEVLETTISYDFLYTALQNCNDLILRWWLSTDKIIFTVQCKGRLFKLIERMRKLEEINNWVFDEEDIRYLNTEYNEINDIMTLIQQKNELVEEVQSTILELPYRDKVINKIDPSYSEAKIIPINHSRMAAHGRVQALQNSIFRTNWEILPTKAIEKIREKAAKLLSTDPITANLYKWDCLAANDEKFPNAKISDSMILQAIKTATNRKDGAFVQSIKNNLIHRAQELEKQSTPSIEKSLLLADHIKNLTPENPIVLSTVVFGKCMITDIKTVEYGDDAHYQLTLVLKNGEKKNIQLQQGGNNNEK